MNKLFNTVTLFSLLLLTACGGTTETVEKETVGSMKIVVTIDNGLDTNTTVTLTPLIEGEKVVETLAGYELKKVQLTEQPYHVKAVTINDSVLVDEDIKFDEFMSGYNLNLLKEDYIIETYTYRVAGPAIDGNVIQPKSFTYRDVTYADVDAQVVKGQLLVPISWQLNIDEELPEEVEISNGTKKAERTKLFRAETFVLMQEYIRIMNEMGM